MAEQYETLILKSLKGTITQEEHETLQQWLDAAPENVEQMDNLKAIWQATQQKKSAPDFQTGDEWNRLKETIARGQQTQRPEVRTIWALPVFRVAAVVIFLIVSVFVLHKMLYKTDITVIRGGEVTTSVDLPDGSRILLNTNSELSYDDNFNQKERVITFKGEAFFDIAENRKKPFIIHTQDATIEVLGTSFNVRAMQNEISTDVFVVTGKVKMADHGSQEIMLLPGESGNYARSNKILTKDFEDNNALSWRDKKLTFKATQLRRVVQSLERYFSISVEFQDQRMGDCRFTSTFDDPTLDEIIEAISVSLDLTFISKGDKSYTIAGKGCL